MRELRRALACAVLSCLLCLSSSMAIADPADTSVKVADASIDFVPAGARTAAAYAVLTSRIDNRLMGATSTAASKIGLHAMTTVNGIMRMRPVLDGVALPDLHPVSLKAMGIHLMLEGLTAPLKPGDSVAVTLRFSKGNPQTVPFKVDGPASSGQHMGSMSAMSGMAMGHASGSK